MARIVRTRLHEAIQSGWIQAERICVIPIDMRFIPKWTGLFVTYGCHVKRSNRHTGVGHTCGRRQLRRIASWIGRSERGICRRIELRQAIECLIGNPVLRPVFAQFSKIVVERAVLLQKEDDVIQALKGSRYAKARRHGTGSTQSHTARGCSRTGSRPAGKRTVRGWRLTESYLSIGRKWSRARSRTIDPGRATRNHSRSRNGYSERVPSTKRGCHAFRRVHCNLAGISSATSCPAPTAKERVRRRSRGHGHLRTGRKAGGTRRGAVDTCRTAGDGPGAGDCQG